MKLIINFILILIPIFSQAAEVMNTHHNVRSNGMGGIYMSIVDNSDALFVNPAALGRTSGLNINLFNLEAGINGLDVYNDFSNIDPNAANTFTQFFGKEIWIRAGGTSAVTVPAFGVGVYTDNQTKLVLHNPAFPQFDTTFISDYGVVVGGSFAMGSYSHGGVAFKRISRWGGQQDIDLGVLAGGDAAAIADEFQNKGNGYGVDLAFTSSLPIPLNPSLSVVWQDVGCTAFTKSAGVSAPPRIHDNLSLGLASSFDLPGLDWLAGVEYQHATESEYHFGQKLHFGTELSLPFIDLRAGLNQGYSSYGIGMNLFFFRFDAAMYSEEMGAYPGQTEQNRIEFALNMNLNFDADFKLMDSSGKKRKLKQRR